VFNRYPKNSSFERAVLVTNAAKPSVLLAATADFFIVTPSVNPLLELVRSGDPIAARCRTWFAPSRVHRWPA